MEGKTVLITGGNEGIGLATALLFAKHGANVAILGRRAEKNEAACRLIQEGGGRCLPLTGDVAREVDVQNAVRRTCDTYGSLHFAFNNAGVVAHPAPLSSLTEDEFDRVVDINLKGVWLCMKHELPVIVASGGGCVVNTGSVASTVGLAMLPSYVASKHGVLGLTRSAALEYAKQGVRVNMVCPGTTSETGIYNEMSAEAPQIEAMLMQAVPMGRLCKPSEIAGTVLYLCSDAASYVTGQAIFTDGGYTVA